MIPGAQERLINTILWIVFNIIAVTIIVAAITSCRGTPRSASSEAAMLAPFPPFLARTAPETAEPSKSRTAPRLGVREQRGREPESRTPRTSIAGRRNNPRPALAAPAARTVPNTVDAAGGRSLPPTCCRACGTDWIHRDVYSAEAATFSGLRRPVDWGKLTSVAQFGLSPRPAKQTDMDKCHLQSVTDAPIHLGVAVIRVGSNTNRP